MGSKDTGAHWSRILNRFFDDYKQVSFNRRPEYISIKLYSFEIDPCMCIWFHIESYDSSIAFIKFLNDSQIENT